MVISASIEIGSRPVSRLIIVFRHKPSLSASSRWLSPSLIRSRLYSAGFIVD